MKLYNFFTQYDHFYDDYMILHIKMLVLSKNQEFIRYFILYFGIHKISRKLFII